MTEATQKPTTLEALAPGMAVEGTVKRIELYGAFVDIGVGTDGLLHISQLGKPNVRNVEDVVKAGDTVTVYVLRIDPEQRRIALSMEKPPAVGWDTLNIGDIVTGKVTRIEQYGVFVDIGAERDGMIHVSELANGFVKSPADVVKVGEDIQAKIIKLDRKKKRIDLSKKELEVQESRRARDEYQQAEEPDEYLPTAFEMAFRSAVESNNKSYGGGKGKGRDRDDRRRDRRDRDQRDMDDIFERTLRGR